MPGNTLMIQPSAWKSGGAALSVANTSETSAATGGVALYTPVTQALGGVGAKVVNIRIMSTATIAASTRIKFWRYDGTTYWRLFDVIATATTPAQGVIGWSSTTLSGSGANPITGDIPCDITLRVTSAINEVLYVSCYTTDTFNVTCEAIEYGSVV